MGMTRNQAEDRATRIWGEFERLRPSGPAGEWSLFATVPSLSGGSPGASYHTMDANGHPTCHVQCQALERLLEQGIGPAIPEGVYWSAEADNFYSTLGNRGMGNDFYRQWRPHARHFPTEPAETRARSRSKRTRAEIQLAELQRDETLSAISVLVRHSAENRRDHVEDAGHTRRAAQILMHVCDRNDWDYSTVVDGHLDPVPEKAGLDEIED